MMPNFLGVGFFRCGTTWLHDLLDAHPDAYVPWAFKELHYFYPQNITRGRAWYESFFPGPEQADRYAALGEIGPGYYRFDCIDRIAAEPGLGESGRFLFMIRNPADMVYSDYRMRVRHEANPRPIEEALDLSALPPSETTFAPFIQQWRERFGPNRVLVTVLEDVREHPRRERERIATFLGLDPARFPEGAGETPRNESGVARHARAFRMAQLVNVWLVRRGLHKVSGLLRASGLKKLFGVGRGVDRVPPFSDAARRQIASAVEPDVRALEDLLDIDLDSWRRTNGVPLRNAKAAA